MARSKNRDGMPRTAGPRMGVSEQLATLRADVERLRGELETHCMKVSCDHKEQAVAAEGKLRETMERHGFRWCDVPACNCNDWHPPDYQPIKDKAHNEALRELDSSFKESDSFTYTVYVIRDRIRGLFR